MTEFNIQDSKIEQLNESGNNYKICGSGMTAISENGQVVQIDGDRNKVSAEAQASPFACLRQKLLMIWKWITGTA